MQNTNPPRHGLSSTECRDLCQKVLSFAKADHTRVNLTSGVRGFTRTAINRVTTAGVSNDTSVQITSVFGKRIASIETNVLEDGALEKAVRDAEILARIAPENPEYLPELGEQKFMEVDGYYTSTGDLSTESRARAATLGINAAVAAKVVAAGFIDVRAGSEAVATSNGLFGYHAGSGVTSTLTMRTSDGLSAGWAGAEAADWNTLQSDRIAEDALRKCEQWRGKTALEPGTYEVILEPAAVALLVSQMRGGVFDARQADEGRSFSSKRGGGNRLSEKLFDERITILANPAEKNAETRPFTNGGVPLQREVWVEKGVLKTLAYSRFWAQKQGVPPRPVGSNFLMLGGGASLDDMIKSTKRGVLITRFWYIRSINPRIVSFTGLTRDGTFLIENGKIARPVTNFRFNQSVTDLLAKVEMVGQAVRTPGSESGEIGGSPIVAPALKVKEFNLASVSDAI